MSSGVGRYPFMADDVTVDKPNASSSGDWGTRTPNTNVDSAPPPDVDTYGNVGAPDPWELPLVGPATFRDTAMPDDVESHNSK